MTAHTQVTTKTVENREEEEEEGEPTPLFDRTRDKKSKTITRIAVRRTDPNEGHLGELPPDASEQDILGKWGGGTFLAQAKNDAGQVVTATSLKLAGDPIFVSEYEENRWRRLNGLQPKARGNTDGGGSLKDVLTLLEERAEKARIEERDRRAEDRKEQQEREERARRDQREHEEKLAREIRETDERRRKDEADREDRRRKEQREDDERRARQHREDLERVEASNKAQLAQTQQFFQQLSAVSKEKGDGGGGAATAIKTLMTGMELAMKMRPEGGGEAAPTDALTAIMSRLPEILTEARETAKSVIHEVTASKKPAAAPALAPARNPRARAAKPDGELEHEITITGPTAARFKQMIAVLQQQKKDPEKVLNDLAAYVIKNGANGANGAASPAPASSAAPRNAPPKQKRSPATRAAPSPRRASRAPAKKASSSRARSSPAKASGARAG
ncbi:MAG: hypothetical protein ABIR60_08530 [Allosphingosinicella sp.]